MQEAQWQAAKANLVPCRNCQRRFAPDRLGVHERVCRGTKKPPPRDARDEEEISKTGKFRTNFDSCSEYSTPNGVSGIVKCASVSFYFDFMALYKYYYYYYYYY